MILAAALLVLLGLGLFLAGVLTGTTAFYWSCVAVCVLAALVLFAARRRIARAEATPSTAVSAAAVVAAAAAAADRAPAGPTRSTHAPEVQPPVSPAMGTEDAAPAGTTASALGAPVEASTTTPEPVADHPVPREPAGRTAAPADLADPPVEDVEVTDLLLVVDLKDEVLVVDEHPRYHLTGCPHLRGRTGIPLPLDEARSDGFTPCAACSPDRHLADRERARRHPRTG